MKLQGWGCYPTIQADVLYPQNTIELLEAANSCGTLITRGQGRSYGDSSLSEQVIETGFHNRLISFDEGSGLLTCDSGITLSEILRIFVPKGWFLPVTPGTQYVSVGGAIASDVHGKNHHHDGTFGQHVTELTLILGNGEIVTATPFLNSELFHATCGGMGLTGIIVSATIRMIRISSNQIIETTIKTSDLDSVLDAFENFHSAQYSVAWVDCLAKGKNLGRSLLMLGSHDDNGNLDVFEEKIISIPKCTPDFTLNRFSAMAFNAIYYNRVCNKMQTSKIRYEKFFYPLDRLLNWNRLYGKKGLIQYQLVLPKNCGRSGMKKVLTKIAGSGHGSFLAVLKAFGKNNRNILSFPMEGYTLALDFKLDSNVLALLNDLDKIVLDYGGRLYLTKDSRMSEATFKASYPNWQLFQEIRNRYHAINKFKSMQSIRLGL